MLLDALDPDQGPATVPIELDPAVAAGLYSNLASVHYAETEFVLDFIHLQPQRDRGKVMARVILHPKQARMLLHALSQAVERHEEAFGPIPVPEDLPKAT